MLSKWHFCSSALCHLTGHKGSHEIDGSAQDCNTSVANTLGMLRSCTKPSKCAWTGRVAHLWLNMVPVNGRSRFICYFFSHWPRSYQPQRENGPWAPSQYKYGLSMYGDLHYENKTVVRPSYPIYNGDPYISKTASLYWDSAHILFTYDWVVAVKTENERWSLYLIVVFSMK